MEGGDGEDGRPIDIGVHVNNVIKGDSALDIRNITTDDYDVSDRRDDVQYTDEFSDEFPDKSKRTVEWADGSVGVEAFNGEVDEYQDEDGSDRYMGIYNSRPVLQEVDVIFPPDVPLGITFKWSDGLIVSAFATDPATNEPGAAELSGQVELGASLVAVNGVDVTGLGFEDLIQLLKDSTTRERSLRFRSYGGGRRDSSQSSASHHSSSSAFSYSSAGSRSVASSAGRSRRRRQRGRAQKKGAGGQSTDPSAPVASPVQLQLQARLELALNPLHLKVTNLSYLYQQRELLKGRMLWYRGAHLNAIGTNWVASIMKVQQDENKTEGGGGGGDKEGGMVKVVVGSHYESEPAALAAAEEAARQRDAAPTNEHNVNEWDVRATHFHVLLVSPAFEGLSLAERFAVVHEALLAEYYTPPYSFDSGWAAASRWKGFGTVGDQVRDLPQFRSLPPDMPQLALELKTPGQWRPQQYPLLPGERFGPSRTTRLSAADDVRVVAPAFLSKLQGYSEMHQAAGAKRAEEEVNKEASEAAAKRAGVEVGRVEQLHNKIMEGQSIVERRVREELSRYEKKPRRRQANAQRGKGGVGKGKGKRRGGGKGGKAAAAATTTPETGGGGVGQGPEAGSDRGGGGGGGLVTPPTTGGSSNSGGGSRGGGVGAGHGIGIGGRGKARGTINAGGGGGGGGVGGGPAQPQQAHLAHGHDVFARPQQAHLAHGHDVFARPLARDSSSFVHFYHGLQPLAKRQLLKDYKQQLGLERKIKRLMIGAKALSAEEKNAPPVPKTGHETAKKFVSGRRRYLHGALILQRIYRFHVYPRLLRRLLLRHAAACTIARVFRGRLARRYATLYLDVAATAALVLQACWRSWVVRKYVRMYRETRERACGIIQPAVRGWIARKYLKWVAEHMGAATKIQSRMRGVLARKRFVVLKAEHRFRTVVLPAVATLQRVYRGHLGRKIYRAKLEDRHLRLVRTPAALALQRTYRGYKGRRRAKERREQTNAALQLQRTWRGMQTRRWYHWVLDTKRKTAAAVKIQARVRAFVAREIQRRVRAQQYRAEVVVVASVKIQTEWRRYFHVSRWEQRKREFHAAQTIVRPWWRYKARQRRLGRQADRERQKQHRAAVVVQCAFRCLLARRARHVALRSSTAHSGAAALAVQRCWHRYKAQRRFEGLKAVWEVEQSNGILRELKDEATMIEEDILDCKEDIEIKSGLRHKAELRLKRLKKEKRKIEDRQPQVETELANLTELDEHAGWSEAFINEKAQLQFTLDMLQEERYGKKLQKEELRRDLEFLQLELNDLDLDREDVSLREVEELELLRRTELARCRKRCKDAWETRVRKQLCQWKVDSVRLNVIRRTRADLDEVKEEAKEAMTLDAIKTMSYQKREKRQVKEAKRARQLMKTRDKTKAKLAREMGYKEPRTRAMLDEVVGQTRTLLRHGTRELRTVKHDIREDPTQICVTCGRVFCVCENGNSAAGGGGLSIRKKRR